MSIARRLFSINVFPYDETLLQGKVDVTVIRSFIRRQHREEKVEYTYQFIEDGIDVELLGVSCMFTPASGTLAIFDIPTFKINIINNLFYFILNRLKVSRNTNTAMELENDMPHFFKIESQVTRYQDHDGNIIGKPLSESFHANVTLTMRGVQYRNLHRFAIDLGDCNNLSPKFIVKPIIVIKLVTVTDDILALNATRLSIV